MAERVKLWFGAYVWAWILVIVASFVQRRRMSHNAGVVASGRVRIDPDPRIPPHDFFEAGREFRCRIRHAPVSFDDQTIVQVRSASIKLADSRFESPLDIEMNTGRYSFFWNGITWFKFVRAREMTDGRQYRAYYKEYPAALAGKDGIRVDPSSYAELYYHSQVAQYFIGKDGVKRYVKFRLIPYDGGPESGVLTPEELEEVWDERVIDPGKSPNYLSNEYEQRVSRGPVMYRLQIQLHTPEPGEDAQRILNCNLEWDPEEHPFLDVAVVEIDRVLSWEEECRMITSVANCPESLALIPATSLEDVNSINYLRAASDIAKHARVFAYEALDAWPTRQPDERPPAPSRAEGEASA